MPMKQAKKLQTLLLSDQRTADAAQSSRMKAEDGLTEIERREQQRTIRNEARQARIAARTGRRQSK